MATANERQKAGSNTRPRSGGEPRSRRDGAGAKSRASKMAYRATDTVVQAASEGASNISHQVTDMLDRQVDNGAEMISQVASSTRLAADDMSERMPQVAGMVRSVADRIDTYAEGMREKTVDQIVGSASDFTRRQPLAVFGLAALAGFVVFRALGNAPLPTSALDPTSMEPRSGRSRRSRANG